MGCDEDTYELDDSKSPKQNTCDILRGLCAPYGVVYEISTPSEPSASLEESPNSKNMTKTIVSDNKRLSYLNALVKLLSKDETRKKLAFAAEELLCWLVRISNIVCPDDQPSYSIPSNILLHEWL